MVANNTPWEMVSLHTCNRSKGIGLSRLAESTDLAISLSRMIGEGNYCQRVNAERFNDANQSINKGDTKDYCS